MNKQLIVNKKNVAKNSRDINKIIQNEKLEDYQELLWLIDECKFKLDQIFTENFNNIYQYYLEKIYELRGSLKLIFTADNPFTIYLDIKSNIRILLKQISGIASSGDWQSPSLTEYGLNQVERETYARTGGSEVVKNFEHLFNQEFYAYNQSSSDKRMGILTSSGMKSIEVALVTFNKFSRDFGEKVFIQDNFYYEGKALVESLCSNVKNASSEEIYELLRSNQEIGCLLLEPGTTWPIGEGINLDYFFRLLKQHTQRKPLFIIIDRTLVSITLDIVEMYSDFIPNHVVLICVESGIKYLQYGMDLINLGHMDIYSAMLKLAKYRDLFRDITYILSAVPDQGLIEKLPRPNKIMIQNRLYRMARNTNLIFNSLVELKKLGVISEVNLSISKRTEISINNMNWQGSLIFIKLHNINSIEVYNGIINDLFKKVKGNNLFTNGGSFGFDKTRVSVVEDKLNPSNCSIRLSIGKESLDVTNKIIEFLVTNFRRN